METVPETGKGYSKHSQNIRRLLCQTRKKTGNETIDAMCANSKGSLVDDLFIQAKKEKALAVIVKEKELEIAQANKEIQEANYQAALYEAKTIKEIGLAKAAVIKAKYASYDRDIYLAELTKDTNISMYENMGNFQIEMPKILNMGKDGGGGVSLQI